LCFWLNFSPYSFNTQWGWHTSGWHTWEFITVFTTSLHNSTPFPTHLLQHPPHYYPLTSTSLPFTLTPSLEHPVCAFSPLHMCHIPHSYKHPWFSQLHKSASARYAAPSSPTLPRPSEAQVRSSGPYVRVLEWGLECLVGHYIERNQFLNQTQKSCEIMLHSQASSQSIEFLPCPILVGIIFITTLQILLTKYDIFWTNLLLKKHRHCICFYLKVMKQLVPKSYVYWTVHHCDSWRIRDKLDVTCYFISLLMCSTCFGH